LFKRALIVLAAGLLGAWLFRTYLFEMIVVATGSMEPTLYVKTNYLVYRSAYRLHGPRRGDIISFVSPADHETVMIKRVIAIGGDTIELRRKQVLVNGALLNEPYTVHRRPKEDLVGDTLGPLRVPDHAVFVLGDNRDVSDDSASWKDPASGQPIYFLSESNIRGRVLLFQ